MSYEALALLTNEAKLRIGEGWNPSIGTCFYVDTFGVTAGGHDPSDPTTAITPDPADDAMPGAPPIFSDTIDSYETGADDCPIFVCRIEQGEVVGGVSSIGLYATIVDSVSDPAEIGTTFLFAVYNRPLLILTGSDAAEFRIRVFF